MMRHDPDNLRPLEGAGPWLHKPPATSEYE